MLSIVYKDLESSEHVTNVIKKVFSDTVAKFPKLDGRKFNFTLSMENAPDQLGPDVFGVKIRISGGGLSDIVVEKKSDKLYAAARGVCDVLLERLNRSGDKRRVVKRQQARSLEAALVYPIMEDPTTEGVTEKKGLQE